MPRLGALLVSGLLVQALGCASGDADETPDAVADAQADAGSEVVGDTRPGDALIFDVEKPEDAACPGTTCSGKCVELKDDPLNCGACGVACTDEQYCSTTTGGPPCKCRRPMVACTGKCTDRDTDPLGCGGCGVSCAVGCSGGFCVASCPAGTTPCATGGKTACIDTATDSRNCGACGAACDTSKLCVGGKCVSYRPAVGCAACPCSICFTLIGLSATCCPPMPGHVAATCVAAPSCP